MFRRFAQILEGIFWKRRKISWPIFVILLIGYWWCLPHPLFEAPTSIVLEDQHGQLLGARIAEDGQWRFPLIDSVPFKFEQALLTFEDRRFHRHWGVDLRSMARAIGQNIRNGKIVSGGSTLSMQVIRLSRQPNSRSVFQKMIEIILATRLEWGYSKSSILRFYATYAPFGGNVVGLETASWRYFGKAPALLSWAEAATLAVLPNSPALIHPGRNREALLAKRNRLLARLYEQGILDSLSLELAELEPLPDQPLPLPRLAPHLLDRAAHSSRQTGRIRSTLQTQLQQQVQRVVQNHQLRLRDNEIHNAAALVVEVSTGQVLAYVGNMQHTEPDKGGAIDMVPEPRSTGSILKPLLYGLALEEGLISPGTLLPDVPASFAGYKPENFNGRYDGMVSAQRALIRSLNVPMVYLLQQFGLEKFHFELERMGVTSLHPAPAHYGLPLILGGAEISLWELAAIYAGLARTVKDFHLQDGTYRKTNFWPLSYTPTEGKKPIPLQKQAHILSASAAWLSISAMQELERPNSLGDWERFFSSRQIAWKTGTSFGFRDAWAIGLTPEYVVAVWCGNADNEGRPGLIGIQAAAPILFDLFQVLPPTTWFKPPFDELVALEICATSGHRPIAACPVDTLWLPAKGGHIAPCPYHRTLHLDPTQQYQVQPACESPFNMVHQSWFVLPPVAEHYYKLHYPDYRELPPYRPDCHTEPEDQAMQFIYPKAGTKIYIPRELDGQQGKTVFQVAHRQPEVQIYWHLDETYLGSTQHFHNLELAPEPGLHRIILVDQNGNRLERSFEILEKRAKKTPTSKGG